MSIIKDRLEDWGYDVEPEINRFGYPTHTLLVSDRATSQKVDFKVYVEPELQICEIWKEPVDFNDGFLDDMKNAVPWLVTAPMFIEAETLKDLLTDENLLISEKKLKTA